MNVLIEGSRGVHLSGRAFLVSDDREVAWAEKVIPPDDSSSS